MSVLFCNIGWMERYQGLNVGDQIIGGGSYVRDEGRGNEICNFTPYMNTFYGYVRSAGKQIDIDRIGAKPNDNSVSGVTVIWTATRPTGGTAVVGWYKNATVFRDYQKFSSAPSIQSQNKISGYRITALSNQAVLLPVDERTLEIPRQIKGGMGQANVWYADKPESASIVKRVLDFIDGQRENKSNNKRGKVKQDQERKVHIEKAAIRLCCEHFEKLGYDVASVEKDNVGWDLEAISGKTTLRIEVKGLSASTFAIELTPNEYRAFSEQSDTYRLAVVINALDFPKLFICRYSNEQKMWVVNESTNKSLQIETKQSASVKCI